MPRIDNQFTNQTGFNAYANGWVVQPGQVPTGLDGFSPEELVEWAETQLGSIDQQVNEQLHAMQAGAQRSSLFAQVTAFVNAFQAAHPAADASDSTQLEIDAPSFQFNMPDGSVATMSLRTALQQCGVNVSTDAIGPSYTGQNVASLANELQTDSSNISNNSETQSIQLQSLMGRRGQVIQLASQLMEALNETDTKVAANIH
jgi:hypothetical protein